MQEDFLKELANHLTKEELECHCDLILKHAEMPQQRVTAEPWLFLLEARAALLKPDDSAEQRLLKRRHNAARLELKALYEQVKVGSQTPDICVDVSRLLLIAALELDPTPAAQLRAHEDHVDILVLADAIFQARYLAGKVNETDMQEVHTARLDAELQLLRLKRPR